MTRIARHWPYYLAFAVLLVMVDVTANVVAGWTTCERQNLAQCPAFFGEQK